MIILEIIVRVCLLLKFISFSPLFLFYRKVVSKMFLFPFFLIFGFFISYQIKKSSSSEKQNKEDYFMHEHNANFVRRKDISNLEYIHVPLDTLPFKEEGHSDLLELQDKVKEIAQMEILNLTGISNTDLKYMYGTVNLDKLTICDNNFIKLSRALYNWGNWLYKNHMTEEARQVFEYAVACKVDISNIYTNLAAIYADNHDYDKIQHLKETVSELNTLMKDSILSSLNSLISS